MTAAYIYVTDILEICVTFCLRKSRPLHMQGLMPMFRAFLACGKTLSVLKATTSDDRSDCDVPRSVLNVLALLVMRSYATEQTVLNKSEEVCLPHLLDLFDNLHNVFIL